MTDVTRVADLARPVDTPPKAATTLVASLAALGVDRVFCVAGESYLPVLDALYGHDVIDVITCRHEGSAGFAALADAKLTGRVGVCLASRGPGAANAAIAVHAAAEDGSPLLLLVGAVPAARSGREVFQDVDCAALFGGIAKAVLTLTDPGAAAELTARAIRTAEQGTPGPVVLVLPEDLLARPDPVGRPAVPVGPESTGPAGPALDAARALLAGSHRPVLLAGARLDDPAGRRLLAEVAQRHTIPVLTSNKHQHLLDNRHPAYAGHLHNATQTAQRSALQDADLVLAVGTRLDRITTGGHRFPAALPGQPLVHVYPDAERIGRTHRPASGLAVDPVAFLRAMAGWPVTDIAERTAWRDRLHGIEVAKADWHPVTATDGLPFGAVVAALDSLTGGDVTVLVDSGTFTSWVYRYLRFGPRGRLVGISSSSMGFAMGGAVAAGLRADDVPTVAVIGDGGFLMNAGELATAVRHRARVVFLVSNNNSYGTIRLHQERVYPGRTIATDLSNPDFVALARSFGIPASRASTTEQLAPCLATALRQAGSGPALVEITTSLEHITAYQRLTEGERGASS
jgi:acetolactate synthase-1/2/3 large subunit